MPEWSHEGLDDSQPATQRQRSFLRAILSTMKHHRRRDRFISGLFPEEVFLFEAEGEVAFINGLGAFRARAIIEFFHHGSRKSS